MRRAALRLALALIGLGGAPGPAAPAPPAAGTPAADEAVAAVARQLRCVVCQNLSVADSPSEMAQQMRELIRERLGRGENPRAIIAYFVERYGEWVLLAPPARGFSLLVWVLPFAGLGAGLLAAILAMRRWSRPAVAPLPATAALDPGERERLRRALGELTE